MIESSTKTTSENMDVIAERILLVTEIKAKWEKDLRLSEVRATNHLSPSSLRKRAHYEKCLRYKITCNERDIEDLTEWFNDLKHQLDRECGLDEL